MPFAASTQRMIRRDHWAGALIALLGAGIGWVAVGYKVGTLRQMGPGFFPLMLGAILVVVGIMIAAAAAVSGARDQDEPDARQPEWFGCLCIIAGVLAFIVLAERAGIVAATFAAVFVAALGDRTANLRSAGLLAVIVTIFTVLVFSYGLQIQLPIVTW
jgi:putative Ca2+/H+ antiporter (TMEM165/GDT1 family)